MEIGFHLCHRVSMFDFFPRYQTVKNLRAEILALQTWKRFLLLSADLEVADQQLSPGEAAGGGVVCDGICGRHFGQVEPPEELTHFRCIVQRQQEAAFDLCQHIGHAAKLAAVEQIPAIVGFAAIIWWIEIKESIGAVILGYHAC